MAPRIVIRECVSLPDATPLTQDSTANAANTLNIAAAAGVAHHITGFSVAISGAATGNIVNVLVKDGSTTIWKEVIANGTAISTPVMRNFMFPIMATVGNALSIAVDAAGAGCITTINAQYYDL